MSDLLVMLKLRCLATLVAERGLTDPYIDFSPRRFVFGVCGLLDKSPLRSSSSYSSLI